MAESVGRAAAGTDPLITANQHAWQQPATCRVGRRVHTSRRPNLAQATVRNTNGLIPSQQIFCFWGRVGDANRHPTRQAQSKLTAVRRSLFGSHFAVDLPSRRSSVGTHRERLAFVRKGVDADDAESRPRLGCRRLQQYGTGPPAKLANGGTKV